MSQKFIPEHIDPFRFAEQGISLEGLVSANEMDRLKAIVISNQPLENVEVSLQFGLDEQGIAYLKGHFEMKLALQCQRCLDPFTYEIMSDFVLGLVHTLEEADALPEGYEPALAPGGNLAINELIEDEIILNLPIIPRHEPEECKVQLPLSDAGWKEGEGENPFKVLKSLKLRRKER